MSPWLADLFLGSQTDERLVILARAGHERAFTTIVDRYRRALIAHARRFDPERAEDLVQQTFLSAYSALQSGSEVRHLRGWLYQILRNLAARTGTASAVETELTAEQAVTESAHETAERRLLAFQALDEVARLPAHQHEALVATALQGRPRTEVAANMGLSEGAVRQLVHRARGTVRTAVTAITPLPVARWFSGARSGSGVRLVEATAGAGTATAGGLALKVGGLVASGVLATGVISTLPRATHHRGHVGIVAANTGSMTAPPASGPAGAGAGLPGVLARVPTAIAGIARPRGEGSASASRGGHSFVVATEPGDRQGSRTSSGSGGGSSGRDGGESSGGSGRSDGGGSGSDGGSTSGTVATSGHDGSGGPGTGSSGSGGDSSSSINSGPGSVDGGGGSGTSGSDGGGTIQTTLSSSDSGSGHDTSATSDGSGTSGSGGGPGPN